MPATTCALVITRSGETTKPLPSSACRQLCAMPSILTTLPRTCSTIGCSRSVSSGGSTLVIGVRPNGPMASLSPELSNMSQKSRGARCSHVGAISLISSITFESRTAAAICGCAEVLIGVARIQAANRTATACSSEPITESTRRNDRVRIPLRAARPSTIPEISPMITSATSSRTPAIRRQRWSSMLRIRCGASSTPAVAPRSTPMNASADDIAPCRYPDAAASNATPMTITSTQADPLITDPPWRAPGRGHGYPTCPTGSPSRRPR